MSKQEGLRKRREHSPAEGGSSIKCPREGNTHPQPENIFLKDVGGREEVINHLLEYSVMPIVHPEVVLHIGTQLPRHVLLHEPPGCGKTMLVNAIAREFQVPFIAFSLHSIVAKAGIPGESERKLRQLFKEAQERAPSLIFIDEIEAIAQMPVRDNAEWEIERRILTEMLTCMDNVSLKEAGGSRKPVMIIGATNQVDRLDPALRKSGRFTREIILDVPDQVEREKILQVLCRKMRVAGDFDFKRLARMTAGFVGSDLSSLARDASDVAMRHSFEISENPPATTTNPSAVPTVTQLAHSDDGPVNTPSASIAQPVAASGMSEPLISIRHFLEQNPHQPTDKQLHKIHIRFADFLTALEKAEYSATSKIEGFSVIPDVTWADVGAEDSIKSGLRMAIVQRIKYPQMFTHMGLSLQASVLLWGPAGCGKSLLAKAVAHESGANFISINGTELLNKYVEHSDKAVRQAFLQAMASVPCVVFLDEFEVLASISSSNNTGKFSESARLFYTLVNQFEHPHDGIYIIAATTRPDRVNPIILQPHRMNNLLFVDYPNSQTRFDILKILLKKVPLSETDLWAIAHVNRCKDLNGRDLSLLVQRASSQAIQESILNGTDLDLTRQHFETECENLIPSISEDSRELYQHLVARFGA